MRNQLWSMMMGALLLSSCATVIHDFPVCAPYPDSPYEELGASCDSFLAHSPESLTKTQWRARQAEWIKKGWAIEVTHSQAIAWNKAELEKLCSVSKCTMAQQKQIAKLWGNLDRAERLGKRVNEIAAQMNAQTGL